MSSMISSTPIPILFSLFLSKYCFLQEERTHSMADKLCWTTNSLLSGTLPNIWGCFVAGNISSLNWYWQMGFILVDNTVCTENMSLCLCCVETLFCLCCVVNSFCVAVHFYKQCSNKVPDWLTRSRSSSRIFETPCVYTVRARKLNLCQNAPPMSTKPKCLIGSIQWLWQCKVDVRKMDG